MKRFAYLLVALALCVGAEGATFQVTNANDSGTGSLRWAIEQANANPGPDNITSSSAIQASRITLLSPLPEIIERINLGGIVIDGSSAGTADGFVIRANDVYVSGLTVTNFSGDGVVVYGDRAFLGNVTSSGNRNGIRLEGHDALIETSVVASNSENGVWVTAAGSRNQISEQEQFCSLGCPLNGYGVSVSGNGSAGIRIEGAENKVVNAHIGVTEQYAPRGDGVVVSGPHNSVTGSTISNSGRYGVNFLAPAEFLGNSGSCNAAGFIGGALIEPPQITFARADLTAVTVTGVFQAAPNATYRIELFPLLRSCTEAVGAPLSSLTVTTDGAGHVAWTKTFAGVFGVSNLVAIATRKDSEVSRSSLTGFVIASGETRADLGVQTTAPATTTVDQFINIVSVVTNYGPGAVDGLRLRGPHTPGAVTVSATPTSGQCTINYPDYEHPELGPLNFCDFGPLAPGESITVRERLRVTASSGTLHYSVAAAYRNTLVSSAVITDPNPANNSSVVNVEIVPSTRRRAAGH